VTIRVLVADDERLVRAGYRMILAVESGIEVVGEAADGVEAVAAARSLCPDVVLMDIRMPRLDGIAATRAVIALDPAPAVVVVTTFDLDEYVYGALRAGAAAFLLKDAPEEHVVNALRGARDGVALFSPSVTRRLIETYAARASGPADPHVLCTLTPRENEVLAHVARGSSNVQVAAALGIGETTVKTHVSRILMRLGLVSRSQAVVVAYETGLVRPGRGTPVTRSG